MLIKVFGCSKSWGVQEVGWLKIMGRSRFRLFRIPAKAFGIGVGVSPALFRLAPFPNVQLPSKSGESIQQAPAFDESPLFEKGRLVVGQSGLWRGLTFIVAGQAEIFQHGHDLVRRELLDIHGFR